MRRSVWYSALALTMPLAAEAQEKPSAQEKPAAQSQEQIYEGWRQYSVHCARCHGQDGLPNPVAANLLVSVAPGGPTADREAFVEVVRKGRPERGMPGFEKALTPEQTDAIYLYVKGRAEKKIPPGRPKEAKG